MMKGPVCSNPGCEKGCGNNSNKWFRRLDYVYCSSECVKAHQRALQAEAALKRFGQ